LLACLFGCCYTMTCWDPEEGKPAGAAPAGEQISR
jgi:hypothetical protein